MINPRQLFVLRKMADDVAHVRFIAAMRESEVDVTFGQLEDVETAFTQIRRELALEGVKLGWIQVRSATSSSGLFHELG
jgi:hypothetical protein